MQENRIADTAERLRRAANRHPMAGAHRIGLWLRTLFMAVLLIVVIPSVIVEGTLAFYPLQPAFWIRCMGALLLAVGSIGYGDHVARKTLRDPEAAAAKLEADVLAQTSHGWVRRTLRLGFLMGLGAGIPVGVLIAAGSAGSIADSAVATGIFVCFTMVWAVPLAFVIRWGTLRVSRRYIGSPGDPRPPRLA